MPAVVGAQLVELTLHRVDELTPAGVQTVYDLEFVAAEIQFAADDVVLNSPRSLFLDSVKKWDIDTTKVVASANVVEIKKPVDFSDIFKFKLSGWSQPALQLGEYDELESIIRCRHGNDSFSTSNPFAALSIDLAGDEVLVGWPGGTALTVEYLLYIPVLEPENLPQRLRDACSWDAAGRILMSDKDWSHLAPAAFAKRNMIMAKKTRRRSSTQRLKGRLF